MTEINFKIQEVSIYKMSIDINVNNMQICRRSNVRYELDSN